LATLPGLELCGGRGGVRDLAGFRGGAGLEKREVIWMASHLRTILQERKELKDKEIVLVEEHKKDIGRYAIVYIKPVKVSSCFCRHRDFLSSQYIYRFGYVFLISDKLKRVGVACQHYTYQPEQETINRDLGRFIKGRHQEFFYIAETDLENKFEQAFGAA
jgi:hypothetical protein